MSRRLFLVFVFVFVFCSSLDAQIFRRGRFFRQSFKQTCSPTNTQRGISAASSWDRVKTTSQFQGVYGSHKLIQNLGTGVKYPEPIVGVPAQKIGQLHSVADLQQSSFQVKPIPSFSPPIDYSGLASQSILQPTIDASQSQREGSVINPTPSNGVTLETFSSSLSDGINSGNDVATPTNASILELNDSAPPIGTEVNPPIETRTIEPLDADAVAPGLPGDNHGNDNGARSDLDGISQLSPSTEPPSVMQKNDETRLLVPKGQR